MRVLSCMRLVSSMRLDYLKRYIMKTLRLCPQVLLLNKMTSNDLLLNGIN